MVLESLIGEIADILSIKAGLPPIKKHEKQSSKKTSDEIGDNNTSISRLDSMFGDLQKYASASRWQSNVDGESIISKDKKDGRTSVNSSLKLIAHQRMNS
jgi:hypothetical protein